MIVSSAAADCSAWLAVQTDQEFPSGPSPGVAAKFSFGALALSQGGGDVMIVDDWACQYNYSWAIETESLCLHTKNAWPYVRDLDGIKMLRNADTNGPNYVFELFGTGELLCYAPGHQACIVHSTAL